MDSDRRRFHPALDVHLPAAPASLRPRLDALLDDHDPFAMVDSGADPDADAGPPGVPAPPGVGAAGVSRRPNSQRARKGELERRVYFFSSAARDAARRAIAGTLEPEGARVSPIDVPDDGWSRRAHASLRAVRIGDLVVAPPWDRPAPAAAAAHLIVIDPSTGFGTGHHATTRLCLAALQRARRELAASRRVLDLGTGSGVLAVAAVRLGARSVVAIDRDPDALANARANIARNGTGDLIEVIEADLAAPVAVARGGDVVVANLTASFFATRPAAILRHLAPGGLLIASGITTAEESEVRAALKPLLLPLTRTSEDEWVGLVFRRPPDGVAAAGVR